MDQRPVPLQVLGFGPHPIDAQEEIEDGTERRKEDTGGNPGPGSFGIPFVQQSMSGSIQLEKPEQSEKPPLEKLHVSSSGLLAKLPI